MLRLLLPAYQQAAKPIEPTMTAFDDPAPCPLARFTGDLLRFLAATANVRREAKFAQGCAHVVIIIAFIQSHALRSLLRRRRSLHDDALDGRRRQFHIVAIGSINRHADGDAMPLVQQRSLDARVPAVGRIGAGFLPPSVALVIAPSMLSKSQSTPFGSSMSIPVFRIGSIGICFRLASTH
jgi:hypothetical protein